MKQIFKNTLVILSSRERHSLLFFVIANVFISTVDIVFLAALIFMAGFYANNTHTVAHLPAFLPHYLSDPNSVSLALSFLILFFVKNMVAYGIGHLQYRFIFRVALRISNENMNHYLEGDYHEYAGIDSSVYIRKISEQPVDFCHYILTGIMQLFSEITLIILTVGAVLWFNAKLFLLLLIILLPAVLALSYVSRRLLKSARLNINTTSEKMIQHLNEALLSYIESNVYDKKKFFTRRYIHFQKLLNKYVSDLQIIQGLPSRFIEVFAVAGFFILVVIHNVYGNENAISLVTIGAFTVAVYKIIPGIAKILNINGQIHAYEITAKQLVKDRYIHKHLENTSIKNNTLHSISFQKVSYHYSQNGQPANAGTWQVDFDIKQGDMIAITGASGKGKTSIINLLLGFIEPKNGIISINGHPTNAKIRHQYWHDIAYSRQHPFLFHDSILKNITLDEDIHDELQLNNAIEISGLQELLDKLPQGIEYIINENGKNISGGQRKRIALARAFYKKASLIILDEPFNELDEGSAMAVLYHLNQLAGNGKMIILITHDKKSLPYCNKIISLDEMNSEYVSCPYESAADK